MRKLTILSTFILLIIVCFNGCSKVPTGISKQGVYFDTIISVSLYDNTEKSLNCLNECFEIADNCEKLFSKSIETSDVSKINNSAGNPVHVSNDTIDVLKQSFKYSTESNGKFSVVCGALTSLWNISSENPYIPTDNEISDALTHVGNDKISIDEEMGTVTLLDPNASIDLGAIAKGYIADKMKAYLLDNGIENGIISLGGNILLIGEKPDNSKIGNTSSPYNIGIQKPFSNTPSETLTSLRLSDTSVVTSGNYQRYFKKDDKIYHHIIDLTTGYPADTGLNSVSIICNSSTDADMLSTICFLIGESDTIKFIETHDDIGGILVSDKNEIIYQKIP